MALEKANGAYIQFLDADDLLDTQKLELSIRALDKSSTENKSIIISNFRMLSIDSSKTFPPFCHLKPSFFNLESFIYQWNESFSIQIQCGLFDATLFQKIRFPENLTAQEDWIVWVKLFKLNPTSVFLDKPLALYRMNPEGRTKTRSILPDQMIALDIFKTLLSEEEFHKFSKVLISRYYTEQEGLKKRLQIVKNSNTYQTGLMIKKVLKTLGMLKLSRKLFPFFLKFKSK